MSGPMILTFSEQESLVTEICSDCREPFRVADLEVAPGRVGHFLKCRCGTRYQDPRGQLEPVHARR